MQMLCHARREQSSRPTVCEIVTVDSAGFTVIELMIAFTILAIVAGSLFQVLYVAARNNERAREYDTANNLTITVAELFKANPELEGEPMFENGPGAAVGRTWRGADGKRLVKYYDERWGELEVALPMGAVDAEAPDGAAYVLEAALGEMYDASPDPNYLTGASRVALDSTQEYRLVVNDTADGIGVLFNGIPREVEQGRVGAVIPINVDFDASGVLPKHIEVVNRTERTVNVNIFGVPNANASGFGTTAAGASGAAAFSTGNAVDSAAANRAYIEVTPSEGALGVMFFDGLTADSVTKTIAVSVRSLLGGGAELARVGASKYVPG